MLRELRERSNTTTRVRLLWDNETDLMTIETTDHTTGETFNTTVPANEDWNLAYTHPYVFRQEAKK